MRFDKGKVYSAVNADELEAGDVVILSDTMQALKAKVTERSANLLTMDCINDDDSMLRFNGNFALAYLVAKHDDPLKDVKIACAKGEAIQCKSKDDMEWHNMVDPSFDSEDCMDYRIKPEYRPFKSVVEFLRAYNTKFSQHGCMWLKCKNTNRFLLVNAYDTDEDMLCVDCIAHNLIEVFDRFTFSDGTPCGADE